MPEIILNRKEKKEYVPIGVYMPIDLLYKVDELRKDNFSRSRFIVRTLKKSLLLTVDKEAQN